VTRISFRIKSSGEYIFFVRRSDGSFVTQDRVNYIVKPASSRGRS
jgi:hypothetical protein